MTVEKQHNNRRGDAVRRQQPGRTVRRMDPSVESHIARQYRDASRRILFLDYDGTLVPLEKSPEMAVPRPAVLELLQHLAADARNTVVIISGRERAFLDRWLGGLRMPGPEDAGGCTGSLILVAEHGGFVRRLPAGWTGAVDAEPAWKSLVRPVLRRHVDRCAGSFIEEKSLSLAWHYRQADPERAQRQSRELKDELRDLVAGDGNLRVLDGRKVIEVKEVAYDKGSAALRLLEGIEYDFLLAVGDDRTDEDVFRVLPATAVTIKVGLALSRARYHLASPPEVLKLLGRLLNPSR